MNLTGNNRKAYLKIFIMSLVLSVQVIVLEAQTGNRVQLPRQASNMQDIVREIERQTNYVVINNGFDLSRRVTVHQGEATVDQIMEGMLSGSGRSYRVEGRYIVIYDPSTRYSQGVGGTGITGGPATVPSGVTQNTVAAGGVPGVFTYPSQTKVPRKTGRNVSSPFLNNTPPMLGIKTNLLYGIGTLSPNLYGEVGLGKKTSLEFGGGINKWNQDGSFEDNKKLVHWFLKPEFRYWLCERFNGHFFGLHAFYGQYNIGGYDIPIVDFEKEFRYEGDAIGGGISYGYHWIWSKRWGMEFNIGVGVAYLDYIKSDCDKCSPPLGEYTKTYFGPTSAGIKLVYLIK